VDSHVVEAVRGEERVRVELRQAGLMPCHLEADGPTGHLVADGHNLWAACIALREQLEADGWLLRVEGARADVHPSAMSGEVGKAYVLRLDKAPSIDDLVETLAPLSEGRAVTVAEQRSFYERWLRTRRTAAG
jgi:hypothetical protein